MIDLLPPRPNPLKGQRFPWATMIGVACGIALAISVTYAFPSVNFSRRSPYRYVLYAVFGVPVLVGAGVGGIRTHVRDKREAESIGLELDESHPFPRDELDPLIDAMRPNRLKPQRLQNVVAVHGFGRAIWQCNVEVGSGKSASTWSLSIIRAEHAHLPRVIAGNPTLTSPKGRRTPEEGRLSKHVQVAPIDKVPIEDLMPLLPMALREALIARPADARWYQIKLVNFSEQWAMGGPWIIHAMRGEYRPRHRADAVLFMSAIADIAEAHTPEAQAPSAYQ